MPPLKQQDRHTRDQTIFYMTKSVDKLSRSAAINIAESRELKDFLLFLVDHGPKEMDSVLKIAAKKAAAAMRGSSSRVRATKGSSFPLSLYPPRPGAGNLDSDSDPESDDDIELVTRDNSAQKEQRLEKPGFRVEQQGEGEGESSDVDEVVEPRPTTEAERETVDNELQRAIAQGNETDEEDLRPKDAQQQSVFGWAAQVIKDERPLDLDRLQISKAEVDYKIETGLTRGDTNVIAKLRESTASLRIPDAGFVFELCQKLDFDRVQTALVKFHRNRRTEIGDNKKMDRIPSMCELKDPDAIYDALRITNAHTWVAKIHRAYGQMKLFDAINEKADKEVVHKPEGREVMTYIWHLEELARRKAGNVSDDEKRAKIQNYKDEYHGGSKWAQVAKWFGGKSVVMVFIVAGIGSQLIAKALKDDQRRALKKLAQYLKSIKKIVSTLGPKSLEDYCRQGHLSEEKIKEVENLAACLPNESDSGSEEEDSHSDVESVAA